MKRSLRIEYGKIIAELGAASSRIIALEADLKESTQSVQFEKAHPKRYIQCGIAEQNMIGVAAGLALSGKIPVVHSFACFISMRACEQIRTTIAYPNLNVKFLASHAGISAGTAGTTHHAIEDIAIMRSMPNMTVLVPGDGLELKQVVEQAIRYNGPVYIRVSASEVEDVYTGNDKFSIGKATLLRPGSDLTLVSTGTLMSQAVQAADTLKKEYGINARVLQIASIKPIDVPAIERAAEETGLIVTLEEHNIAGGLGSAVAEIAAEAGHARVKRLGITDHFCEVGSFTHLMDKEKLNTDGIVKTILSAMNKNPVYEDR